MLATSLALQEMKEVGAVTGQEDSTSESTCKTQWYIILMPSSSILGLVLLVIL